MWGERPAAYLGITVPGFPNFFCMYGPGTNLAHGGSLIFHSECQMRYITQCLEALVAGGHRTMEPRVDRYEDWHERSQRELQDLVWSQPSVEHSFFKNSAGEIHVLSPWRLVDYWTWTRSPTSPTSSWANRRRATGRPASRRRRQPADEQRVAALRFDRRCARPEPESVHHPAGGTFPGS